ncbi:MAG: hypothetical protein EBY22_16815, partial [Gammaproteobacteria bacterium]|nr:hypothetical protein [Gammaproteobacteria bacterium]
NYATIQGSTDTTLTATNGSINNYSTGKITGGSGTTTINALNNAFNNLSATSLLTSNNNAIFNVKDLNNNGAIDVANNLTTNVSNNLNNNSTALIWSGNDMTLNVANILTNTSADIYATNNLTIQKNSAGDKTTSVQNVSGEIATYNGDIVINAATFSNIRALSPVQEGKILSMPNARNSTNMDYWKKYAQNCSGNNCENWSYYYAGWSYPKDNSTSAKLSSGKNLTLNLSSFYNESSDVTSVGNMNINFQNSFNNYSIKSLIGNFVYVFIAAWDRDYHVLYNANTGAIIKGGDDTVIPSNYLVVFPAYIKAGSSLTIAQNGVNKNSTFVNSTNVLQNTSVSKVDQQTATTTINKIDIYTLGQTGALTVDLSAITTAIGNNRSATSGSSQ